MALSELFWLEPVRNHPRNHLAKEHNSLATALQHFSSTFAQTSTTYIASKRKNLAVGLKYVLSIVHVFDLILSICFHRLRAFQKFSAHFESFPSRMCSLCNLCLSSDRWLKESDSLVRSFGFNELFGFWKEVRALTCLIWTHHHRLLHTLNFSVCFLIWAVLFFTWISIHWTGMLVCADHGKLF